MRDDHISILIWKITVRLTLTHRPDHSAGPGGLLLAGCDFFLYPQVEFGDVDNDALMYALANQIAFVSCTYPEFDDAALNVDDFCGRGHIKLV